MSGATDASTTQDRALRSQLSRTDPYLEVPEGIRLRLSRKQWAFLTDSQRAGLTREFCDPDWIHHD